MCQFLETIQLCDGQFMRLARHQSRLERAMADFYPTAIVPALSDKLGATSFPTDGLYKCRVIYDSEIRLIEFHPYVHPVIRSLKIVETNISTLPYKMADRRDYQDVSALKGNCDDVLLVKNGLLTDTSYCNIALFDGENWVTPLKPLIQGVTRAQLLEEGKLIAKDIKLEELMNFQKIALFNALNEFGSIQLEISAISVINILK
ncbi:MAG TPA: aminotransferase class IV [Paludibacter sp.]|nr:aminotransferase class IV [Paludibacter sp.]